MSLFMDNKHNRISHMHRVYTSCMNILIFLSSVFSPSDPFHNNSNFLSKTEILGVNHKYLLIEAGKTKEYRINAYKTVNERLKGVQ